MSVQDETWDRPSCSYCGNKIKHAQQNRHKNGICKKIVNIKAGPKSRFLYIGRKNSTYGLLESVFANPFVIGKDGDREEVIKKFEEYALTNPILMESLPQLDSYNFLGCWCLFPHDDCHGRVLLELREKQKLEQKSTLIIEKKKIAVVGSRDWIRKDFIFDVLNKNIDKIKMIVSGGCIGPDSFANDFAKEKGLSILIHYPKWKNDDNSINRAAGFERNTKIIEDADIVLAFQLNSSHGTQDSIDKARKLGKKVIVYNEENLNKGL